MLTLRKTNELIKLWTRWLNEKKEPSIVVVDRILHKIYYIKLNYTNTCVIFSKFFCNMIYDSECSEKSRQQSNIPSQNRTLSFPFNLNFIIKLCPRNSTDIQFRLQQNAYKRRARAHTHTHMQTIMVVRLFLYRNFFLLQANHLNKFKQSQSIIIKRMSTNSMPAYYIQRHSSRVPFFEWVWEKKSVTFS